MVEPSGEVSFFVWKVMFLGVSDAVFIFSAILKPIRVFLNNLAIRNCFYIGLYSDLKFLWINCISLR